MELADRVDLINAYYTLEMYEVYEDMVKDAARDTGRTYGEMEDLVTDVRLGYVDLRTGLSD